MEQLVNLASTSLASNYTAGSGSISVTSASGFPSSGTFSVSLIVSGSVVLVYRVSSVSGTTFNGAAESADVNVSAGATVIASIISVAALAQIKIDWLFGDDPTSPAIASFPTQEASAGATSISFSNDSNDGFAGMLLSANCNANDTNIVAELQAIAGSTPYSYRMRFWPGGGYNQYAFCGGLVLYNSGSGELIVFGGFSRGQAPSNGPELRIAQFSSTSSFNSSPLEAMAWGFPGRFGLCDIKIVDNGTHRTYYIIPNGSAANQVQFYQENSGTYITPTHVGVFVAPGSNQTPNGPVQIKVVDFTQGTS